MRKRIRLSVWAAAGVAIAGALGFTLAALAIQPGSFAALLGNFAREPLLILLNFLPALLLTVFLWLLCGNPFYAASGAGLLVCFLSYVNLIKTGCRNDPLVPADLSLLREALTATQEYALDLHFPVLAALLLAVLAVAAGGLFFRCPRPRLPFRLAGAAAAALAFVLSVSCIYTSDALYARLLPEVDRANVPLTYESCGFPYCFLANYGRYTVQKPADYFPEEVERWAQTDEKVYTEPEAQPNVVFVMCEAFSDLSDAGVFTDSPEDDPLRGFHALAASNRAVSGKLVVNNFGAGTANTEFDVLTGIQTAQLGVNSAFRAVRRNLNSLPRAFARAGYERFFLHPGYAWYYNRESVYPFLGIDDCIFEDAFGAADYKGPTVSDAAFLRVLTAELDARLQQDTPVFAFSVTIQNHQAYTAQKYGEVPPAQVSVPLTEAESETLSVYLQGVRDSSEMLAQLAAYLDTVDKPTILVFFGDHRPALGSVYDALGISTDGLAAFEVPYLVWTNRAFTGSLPTLPARMDANYLGAAVYDLAGLSGSDAYFDALTDAMAELPVFSHGAALTPAQQTLADKLDRWAYYRITEE